MDLNRIRRDFPLLEEGARQRNPIVYLDNACQSLRPQAVLEAVNQYYLKWSACSGRSMHKLGEEVNRRCDEARSAVAGLINASRKEEVVFTRNTTEGINLVAACLKWQKGDVVLLSDKEHNSNLLPWQELNRRHGVVLRIIPSRMDNSFDPEACENLLDEKVKLVSLGHTHNLDGVSIPAREIVRAARRNGSLVLLDAAQAVPRWAMDVKKLDVDFMAFSGHKMLGPSGTGVLYGKYGLLEHLEPYMVGGGTVVSSTYDSCRYLPPPEKFEAGLQDYAGIIGLGAAVRYLGDIGYEAIRKQELLLNRQITEGLSDISGLKIIGPSDPEQRGGIVSFYREGTDAHRVALMLDQMSKIMVRSGQHCVHSWFDAHRIPGSVRASVYFYNTSEEAGLFVEAMRKIAKVL